MQNGIEFLTATCLNWINVLEKDDYKKIITNSLRPLLASPDCELYYAGFQPDFVFPLALSEDAKYCVSALRIINYVI